LANLLVLLLLTNACTTIEQRPGYVAPSLLDNPRTIDVTARSSLAGRPMAPDPDLSRAVASAFLREFPQAQVVSGEADLTLIVVVVDYEPGCGNHCSNSKLYRNWGAEVLAFKKAGSRRAEDWAMAFAFDGHTHSPFFDLARSFARAFHRYVSKGTP
jgi:hypothetical protein